MNLILQLPFQREKDFKQNGIWALIKGLNQVKMNNLMDNSQLQTISTIKVDKEFHLLKEQVIKIMINSLELCQMIWKVN